jgi:hypothetical protein
MIKAQLLTKAAAIIAAIAVIGTIGVMGGGIGQKQIALAQQVNCTPILVRPLGVLTCLSEEIITDLGPACDITRLNPRITPFFENFPLDIIQDLC